MNNKKVAVCSRSFSRNKVLREKLSERYPLSTFNDEGVKLQGDSLVAFLKGHEKAIIALENIDETILKQLPELEVISKYGVGLDMIDLIGEKLGGYIWIGFIAFLYIYFYLGFKLYSLLHDKLNNE